MEGGKTMEDNEQSTGRFKKLREKPAEASNSTPSTHSLTGIPRSTVEGTQNQAKASKANQRREAGKAVKVSNIKNMRCAAQKEVFCASSAPR